MSEQEFQGQRSRSPAYPYLSLPEVVEHADAFFKKYRANKVPISIALKDMGYSASSGSGVRVISALLQFGLFETEGTKDARKITLSDLGRSIVQPNPSNPDGRLPSLREAALMPEMHRWIFDHYSLSTEPLPSDEVLSWALENERGFTDKAALAFIKEFKETYEYAQLEGYKDPIQTQKHEEEPKPTDTVNFDHLFSGWGRSPQTAKPVMTNAPSTPESREFTTSLTRGKTARLIIPLDMNRKDFQLLVKWLDLLSEAELYEEEVDEEPENRDEMNDS